MAHGYFLGGPWVVLGPLRDSEYANLGGLIPALANVIFDTGNCASYGLVSFHGKAATSDPMKSYEGWSKFAAGFFIGGMGSAFVDYFLLDNLCVVDGIMRWVFNQ